MSSSLLEMLRTEAKHLDQAGLLRRELPLGAALCNLASSDYLGLSRHPDVKRAAKAAIDAFGVSTTSSRMVAGTLALHQELEKALASFLATDDAVAFASGYQANAGLFEALLSDRDFVFCDEQLRPSLADGARLSRARVYSYRHADLTHLEDRLKRSRAARFRLIATDGVFPLSGATAALSEICALGAKYGALVVVDDTHGVGVLGATGRGSCEAQGVAKRVDLVTGSFSAALGGSGGFVAGRREILTWLRQKSRPHLASSALSPPCAGAALEALGLVRKDARLREALHRNTHLFREALLEGGLDVMKAEHPAVSVLVAHAVAAQRVTDALHRKGYYALGSCFPVVPEGAARVRAQVTAEHTQKALKAAAEALVQAVAESVAPKP